MAPSVTGRIVRVSIFLVCLAVGASMASGAPNGSDTSFTNPLIARRADPWIYRHTDGFYYFSATVPEFDRIELRKSATIGGLASAKPVVVWRKHVIGEMGGNIWAPELHFIDGAWYIYFSAGSSFSPFDVLENRASDPLEGKWVEKGRIRTAWDFISIDGTTFESAGTRYFVWAQSRSADPNAPWDLFISKMSNPWTLVGNPVMISTPNRAWELRKRAVNEGPAVLRRNGRVFITYSANRVDESYCMGMLSALASSDLLDPASWRKSETPVFDSNPGAAVWGPGHNSFTTSPDGSEDYLVFHARSTLAVREPAILDPNRDTRVEPFSWKADGFPDFGRPLRDAARIR